MNDNTLLTPPQVQEAFRVLLAERKARRTRTRTQAELAQIALDHATVGKAEAHTTGSIVQALAKLQLDYVGTIESLATQLQDELEKLTELQTAARVSEEEIQELASVKIAADALHLLRQHHTQQRDAFDAKIEEQYKTIAQEQEEQRRAWEKEQKEHDLSVSDYTQNLAQEREKELADYKYELDRTFKVEADEFAERKKVLLRTLEDETLVKQKDHAKREKALSDNAEKTAEYKTKVENAEKETAEAVKKAREIAAREASQEAKNRAELADKEASAAAQVAAHQIQTLEDTLTQQASQIEKLQGELRDALTQMQSLSLKAVEKR